MEEKQKSRFPFIVSFILNYENHLYLCVRNLQFTLQFNDGPSRSAQPKDEDELAYMGHGHTAKRIASPWFFFYPHILARGN